MASGYLTERQLEDQLELPAGLPLTELAAGDNLVLATVQLNSARQRLSHRVLFVHVVGRNPAAPETPTKVNASLGYAYVALFDAADQRVAASETIAGQTGPLNLPLTATRTGTLSLSGPVTGSAVYTLKLVNNCADVDLKVCVTGQLRVNLNANP